MVHDAQLDYYGRRLATCSSDRSIKIWDLNGDQHSGIADLKGHEGPVWQVCWGHPKYGSPLASCSFDHKAIVWKEAPDGQWVQIYRTPAALHTASINSVSWAPYELGLLLACASSDGSLSVIEHKTDGSWITEKVEAAHPIGCTAVSWSPAVAPGDLVSAKSTSASVKKLVTAGCDNTAKIWACGERGWGLEQELKGHTDWVRDVAWSPNVGLPKNTIATCGQDGKVFVWSESLRTDGAGWERTLVNDFKTPVWRVSWSVTGNILAVSDANNHATLWKETLDGVWQQVTQ